MPEGGHTRGAGSAGEGWGGAREQRILSLGDPEAMATPTLTRRYDIAPALHGGLETASATALYRDGRLQLWIASQAPSAARRAAAKALGLSERDVTLYPMGAGGSFEILWYRRNPTNGVRDENISTS